VVVLLGRKILISRWRCFRKKARPRGSRFSGGKNVLGTVDSSEGVSSGPLISRIDGGYSQRKALLGIPYRLSLGVFKEMGHMS